MKTLGVIFLAVTNILLSQKYKSEALTAHVFIRYSDQIIKGENSSANIAIDLDKKTINAELEISEFDFQEQIKVKVFGRDVMETKKFPKAILAGTLKQQTKDNYLILGTITIRGIHYDINFPAKFKFINNQLTIDGSFLLKYIDFEIKIPQKESKKIKNEVKVSIQGKLEYFSTKNSAEE